MIALALVVLAIVQALAFAGIVARQSRAHARREDLLLNQLLHAVGKPWQEAPASHVEPDETPPEPGRFVANPREHLNV